MISRNESFGLIDILEKKTENKTKIDESFQNYVTERSSFVFE